MGCNSSQFTLPLRFKPGKVPTDNLVKQKSEINDGNDSPVKNASLKITTPVHPISEDIEKKENSETKDNNNDAYKENALIQIFEHSIEEPNTNRLSKRTPLTLSKKSVPTNAHNTSFMDDFDFGDDDDVADFQGVNRRKLRQSDVLRPITLFKKIEPINSIISVEDLKIDQQFDIDSIPKETNIIHTIQPTISTPIINPVSKTEADITNPLMITEPESQPLPNANRLSKRTPLTLSKKILPPNTQNKSIMDDFDDDNDIADFQAMVVREARKSDELSQTSIKNIDPMISIIPTDKLKIDQQVDVDSTPEDQNTSSTIEPTICTPMIDPVIEIEAGDVNESLMITEPEPTICTPMIDAVIEIEVDDVKESLMITEPVPAVCTPMIDAVIEIEASGVNESLIMTEPVPTVFTPMIDAVIEIEATGVTESLMITEPEPTICTPMIDAVIEIEAGDVNESLMITEPEPTICTPTIDAVVEVEVDGVNESLIMIEPVPTVCTPTIDPVIEIEASGVNESLMITEPEPTICTPMIDAVIEIEAGDVNESLMIKEPVPTVCTPTIDALIEIEASGANESLMITEPEPTICTPMIDGVIEIEANGVNESLMTTESESHNERNYGNHVIETSTTPLSSIDSSTEKFTLNNNINDSIILTPMITLSDTLDIPIVIPPVEKEEKFEILHQDTSEEPIEAELVLNRFQQFIAQENEVVVKNMTDVNIDENKTTFSMPKCQEIALSAVGSIDKEENMNGTKDSEDKYDSTQKDSSESVNGNIVSIEKLDFRVPLMKEKSDLTLDSYRKSDRNLRDVLDDIEQTEILEESENAEKLRDIPLEQIKHVKKYEADSVRSSLDSYRSSQKQFTSMGLVRSIMTSNHSTTSSYKEKQHEYIQERTDFLNKVNSDLQSIEHDTMIKNFSVPIIDAIDVPAGVSSVRDRVSKIQSPPKQEEKPKISPQKSLIIPIRTDKMDSNMEIKRSSPSGEPRKNVKDFVGKIMQQQRFSTSMQPVIQKKDSVISKRESFNKAQKGDLVSLLIQQHNNQIGQIKNIEYKSPPTKDRKTKSLPLRRSLSPTSLNPVSLEQNPNIEIEKEITVMNDTELTENVKENEKSIENPSVENIDILEHTENIPPVLTPAPTLTPAPVLTTAPTPAPIPVGNIFTTPRTYLTPPTSPKSHILVSSKTNEFKLEEEKNEFPQSVKEMIKKMNAQKQFSNNIPNEEIQNKSDLKFTRSKSALLEKYQSKISNDNNERLSMGKKDGELLGVKRLVGKWGDTVRENSYRKKETKIDINLG